MKFLTFTAPVLLTIVHQWRVTAAAAAEAIGGPSYPVDVVAQNYTDAEGVLCQGFLSLPPSMDVDGTQTIPAVVILHDQSGPDTYEQQRATMVSRELGYVGFVADMFGVETVVPEANPNNPWGGARPKFVGGFTGNATLMAIRIEAAVDHVKTLPGVDANRVALIGYCLGGTGVVHYLNRGLTGASAGAVGFHPSIIDWPGPVADITIPSLFLTGGNDFLTGPQAMAKLEDDMNGAGVGTTWETVRYAKINHAFTNWFSQGYDKRADARSWNSMTSFLEVQFGQSDYQSDLSSKPLQQTNIAVNYTDAADDDFLLKGYISNQITRSLTDQQLIPVVIIIPDKNGPNLYEQQRAQQVAEQFGYLGFVADVYGHERMTNPPVSPEDLQNPYGSNATLFVSRIRAAVDYVKGIDDADPANIAIVGFGLGGTGVLHYAMTADGDEGVKAVASFHGGLDRTFPNATAAVTGDVSGFKPQILIQSGGDGDAMSDIIRLEETLIRMDADYEISRYSDVQHAFTNWNDDEGLYDPRASVRSFEALESVFREVFAFSSNDENTEGVAPTKSPVTTPVVAVAAPTEAPVAAAAVTASPVAAPAKNTATPTTTVTSSSAAHLPATATGSFGSVLAFAAIFLPTTLLM